MPNGYWTKERCAQEAKKYKSRSEFRNAPGGAYGAACRGGFYDEICSHMESLRKPNNYWTRARCAAAAKKYSSRTEFQKSVDRMAYVTAHRKGFLDDICSHMISSTKPHGYWTKKRCIEEAKKYCTRNELNKGSKTAYNVLRKKGWLDEACSHMKKVGNRYTRYLYAFEFEDNCVYVGLTHDLDKRHKEHTNMKNSAVNQHLKECSVYKFVTSPELHSIDEIGNKEAELILKYEKAGWTILNKDSAGALGSGIRKWTKETVMEALERYGTLKALKENCLSAYSMLHRQGWTDLIRKEHRSARPKGYWTKEKCLQAASKCRTRGEFRQRYDRAYSTARIENFLDEICSHMPKTKPKGYWTKEKCAEEALKYNSKTEFSQNNSSAFSIAHKRGWIDEICAHMDSRLVKRSKSGQ